jgi:hypothetical protein
VYVIFGTVGVGGVGLSEEILRFTLESTFDAALDTLDAALATALGTAVGGLDVVVTASGLDGEDTLDAAVLDDGGVCTGLLVTARGLGTFFHPHALPGRECSPFL